MSFVWRLGLHMPAAPCRTLLVVCRSDGPARRVGSPLAWFTALAKNWEGTGARPRREHASLPDQHVQDCGSGSTLNLSGELEHLRGSLTACGLSL